MPPAPGASVFIELPIAVTVGGILGAVVVQFLYHAVQSGLPQIAEPVAVTEPFHQRGADCVVGADKQTTSKGACQNIVTEPPQGPDLGAVVGAVDGGGHITAAGGAAALGSGILSGFVDVLRMKCFSGITAFKEID